MDVLFESVVDVVEIYSFVDAEMMIGLVVVVVVKIYGVHLWDHCEEKYWCYMHYLNYYCLKHTYLNYF